MTDGDAQSAKFLEQIHDRGFQDSDLTGRHFSLPAPNNLEAQLIADGHEHLLRDILSESGVKTARTCSLEEFRKQLDNRKTAYMGPLALRVAGDKVLAARMPKAYVDLIVALRDGTL